METFRQTVYAAVLAGDNTFVSGLMQILFKGKNFVPLHFAMKEYLYVLCYLIVYFLPRQFTAFSLLLSKIDERDTIKTKDPARGKGSEYRRF
jgi:hypothetical protein